MERGILVRPEHLLRLIGSVGEKVGELIEKVGLVLEKDRDALVDLPDALLAFAVLVEDLEEGFVDPLVAGKALFDLINVVDCLVELHGLLAFVCFAAAAAEGFVSVKGGRMCRGGGGGAPEGAWMGAIPR